VDDVILPSNLRAGDVIEWREGSNDQPCCRGVVVLVSSILGYAVVKNVDGQVDGLFDGFAGEYAIRIISHTDGGDAPIIADAAQVSARAVN
jgi:hypothetical protein